MAYTCRGVALAGRFDEREAQDCIRRCLLFLPFLRRYGASAVPSHSGAGQPEPFPTDPLRDLFAFALFWLWDSRRTSTVRSLDRVDYWRLAKKKATLEGGSGSDLRRLVSLLDSFKSRL